MRNNTKHLGILATVIAGTAAMPAAADITTRHGGLCAPKHDSRDLVGVDERGMYNASTTSFARITCPVVDHVSHEVAWSEDTSTNPETTNWRLLGTTHVSDRARAVTVYGRDLSATIPFSCYVFWTEPEGFSSWGPTRYMCSQRGGCADSTSEYTGLATIEWSLPIISKTALVGVLCTVPPATSAGQSYVKAVAVEDLSRALLNHVHRLGVELFSMNW